MSIIILAHGTSGNRAQEILKHGFDCTELVWGCADPDVTYFYQVDKFAEAESLEDEDLEYQIERTIEYSNESAQITAAIEKYPMDKTVVFEITIEYNESNEDRILGEIMEDLSCPNMADCGAVCIDNDIINNWIKLGIAKVKVHEFEFIPKMSLCYICGLYNNDYFQETLCNLPENERRGLEILSNAGIFFEDLMCPNEISTYEINKEDWNND